MNPDGTMMRGAALERYAIEHGLTALTIAELADYRQHRESQAPVEQRAQTIMADALI